MVKIKYNYEYVKSFIEGKGGELLSKLYKNTQTKLRIKCKQCLTVWNVSFVMVMRNNWCSKCSIEEGASKRRKYNIDSVRREIEKRNGILLSEEYLNIKDKLKVSCSVCKTIWFPTFNNILYNGHWCRVCASKITADNQRNTIEYIRDKIKEFGGTLVSDKYINNKGKLMVSCDTCNYVWGPSFGNITNGEWCPQCASGKTQKKLVKIIKGILPCDSIVNVNYKGLYWLYNKKTKKKQEIDIYIPSLKLAIEYDGQQHFFPVCFGGINKEEAKIRFKRTKCNDRRKNRLMKKHTEDIKYFIRFNYKERLTKGYVLEKLIKNGIPINND